MVKIGAKYKIFGSILPLRQYSCIISERKDLFDRRKIPGVTYNRRPRRERKDYKSI